MRRKKKVDRRRVKAWMVMENVKAVDIQRALNQKSITQVVETLSGVRDDCKVLAWLRDQGCPVKLLKLPKRMKEN